MLLDLASSVASWIACVSTVYVIVIIALGFMFPKFFNTETVWMCVRILIRERAYVVLAVFTVNSIFAAIPNKTFARIDQLFFNKEFKKIEEEFFEKPNRMVFICGHPRSGTTNLQKSMVSRPHTIYGQMKDWLLFPLILKYLFYPIAPVLDYLFFRCLVNIDIKNHAVGFNEEEEEDWISWGLCENNLFGLANYPPICRDEEWAREALKLKEYQLDAIK